MCVDAAKNADNTMACLPSDYTAVVLYVIDSPLYAVDSMLLSWCSESYIL